MDFSRFDNFPPEKFENKHIIKETFQAWLDSLSWRKLTNTFRNLKAKLVFEKQEMSINEILYDEEFKLIRESHLYYDTMRQEAKDAFDFYERGIVNEIYGNIALALIIEKILEHINSDLNDTIDYRDE